MNALRHDATPVVEQLASVQVSRPVTDPPLSEQVVRRVRLRAQCRIAWLRKLWSEEDAPGGDAAVTDGEVDTHLLGRDSPEAEEAWISSESRLRPVVDELRNLEQAMHRDPLSRLNRLRDVLGLEAIESDLVQACLALEWDRSLSRVYAYAQDHASRGYVTESLVASLFGHGRGRILNPDSPLLQWMLVEPNQVEPGHEAALLLDPAVKSWLEGSDRLRHSAATATAPIHENVQPLKAWPVSETGELVNRWQEATPERPITIQVLGQRGQGRRTFATMVCRELGIDCHLLDASAVPDAEWRPTVVRATRHALLTGGALVWCLDNTTAAQWPSISAYCAVQFLLQEPDVYVPQIGDAMRHSVELPAPPASERRALWERALPNAASWSDSSLDQLAEGYRAVPGSISDIGARQPSSAEEAAKLLRQSQRNRLGDLAELLETPFSMDDLVVHDHVRDVLDDLIYEARHRGRLWERDDARRLFPQGRGLVALFNGPPGSGKTMACQVVAASLGFDLFRIDLSTVVSKYVGETSENLARVLSRAARMDTVLLFDEADALFGRRTEVQDAHDRYANTDTGHLLQAIESYPGIALLATNKKSNMDPAFTRRLRYIVDFAKPDAYQRAILWQRTVEELLGHEDMSRLSCGIEVLSHEVEATGAEIKFAVLSAYFAAQRNESPVQMRHLVKGLDRELTKSGKGISDRDKERLAANG